MIDANFIDKIIQVSEARTFTVGSLPYSDKKLYPVDDPAPQHLSISTLSGIVDYAKMYGMDSDGQHFICVSFEGADIICRPLTKFGQIQTRLKAEAIGGKFHFGHDYDLEEFIIAIQGQFVQDDNTAAILRVVGNIKDERVMSFGDDGITQSVTAKAGLALVKEVPVPNPITLRPYRTFMEVEQPASRFVFRLRSGDGKSPRCSLHEADGGLWKNEAIQNIKGWLRESLPLMSIIA